ncbi:uncharacterized protein N7496_008781 [Penicillium cataractarum]|uniref:Uncharacterized protein n=1 Tax=Penicillium cataractarum TaxID=2100454 RepID=A0A9W9RZB9_9EURO|nr:uncharacterized protein N7496_008781 [Penicillium cataractarum]KAJ5369021.1 hypothetical protein N7496_008781 [Penicillium cataractarum]
MAPSYRSEILELINLTSSPPPSPPPASQSSSSATYPPIPPPIEPVTQYTQSAQYTQSSQYPRNQSSHALTSVSGVTSEIRTQRIQGGLFSQQRTGTFPNTNTKKSLVQKSSQNYLVSKGQIFVEITFYIWHCEDITSKYLEELHSASHVLTPYTISTLEEFIAKDLLPALDLTICSFERQQSDQVRLATSIKKHKPIFLTYDNTSRQASEDIMERFPLSGNQRQINVIFVRSDQNVKAEQEIKPSKICNRKPRRPRVHRVQIKKELEDPQPEDDDSDLWPELLSPSELFGPRQEDNQEDNQEVIQEVSQEINQEISQEVAPEVAPEVAQEAIRPRRRQRATSSTNSIVSPPRTRKRYRLKSQDHERMQASGPIAPSWSRSQD